MKSFWGRGKNYFIQVVGNQDEIDDDFNQESQE